MTNVAAGAARIAEAQIRLHRQILAGSGRPLPRHPDGPVHPELRG